MTAAPAVPWTRDRRLITVGLVLAALAGWGWFRPAPKPPQRVPTRAVLDAPETTLGGWRYAISPDGQWIVAGGVPEGEEGEALYIRPAGDTEWRRLPNTDNGIGPTFSPDGQSLAFRDASGGISRVPVTGGPAIPIVESGSDPQWGEDNVITFSTVGSIYRVGPSGGEPELVFADTIQARLPQTLPGGRAVVFSSGLAATSRILLYEIETGEVRELVAAGNQPRYVPTGHIVYGHADGALMGVPFDLETLAVTGPTITLLPQMDVYSGGASQFVFSESGTLIYASGNRVGAIDQRVLWVGRDGSEEAIPVEPSEYGYARVSPDGRRLLLDTRENIGGEILVWDLTARTLARLNLGEGDFIYPAWTPDGTRVAYSEVNSQDIFWKAANNTGEAAVLLENVRGNGRQNPEAYFFAPDGSAVVYREQNSPETRDDLVMVSLESGEVVWRLASEFNERNPALSANGRWMAYQSDESGTREVYVRPFPDVDADQRIVSSGGGEDPLFSPDGTELFYVQPGNPPQLISVPVDTEAPSFTFGERRVLMDWPYYGLFEGRTFDISPDGRRFAVIAVGQEAESGADAGAEVYIVTDWFEELRARMGGR